MSEAAAVGRSVVKVRATDQDTGPNAEITYKIISGDDQGKICQEKCRCAQGRFVMMLLRARGAYSVFKCSEMCV